MWPDLDKINAPHTDAHWVWDRASAQPVYDYHVAIFGCNGRYTMEQFLCMTMQYEKYVEPFADPIRLSKE